MPMYLKAITEHRALRDETYDFHTVRLNLVRFLRTPGQLVF